MSEFFQRPDRIQELGYDFKWDEQKLWALDVPTETMALKELVWHFDIPFWEQEGTDDWNLTPWEVIRNPVSEPTHYRRISDADLAFPIDVTFRKGRWISLDGLHRLAKAYMLGLEEVAVRKIPSDDLVKIIKR